MDIPLAPLPACDLPELEEAFARLPLDRILDQLMGYSQYAFFAVNDLEVPDVYTDARPEALHDVLLELVSQLRDLLPPDQAGLGELACLRCYDYLDGIHRCMAPHLFKLGYLFGCKQSGWREVSVYTVEAAWDA